MASLSSTQIGGMDGVEIESYGHLFDQFWSRFRPLKAVDDATSENGAASDEGPSGVVYTITKKTDYWFDREVFTLERDARKALDPFPQVRESCFDKALRDTELIRKAQMR